MHKQTDFEIDFDGRKYGINPIIRKAAFELEVFYSALDDSFANPFGSVPDEHGCNEVDEVSGKVLLLNEDGDVVKELSFELIEANPF
jgi:hypothetical protein